LFSPDDPRRRSAEQKGWRCHRRRRHRRRRRFKEAFLFVFSTQTDDKELCLREYDESGEK